MGQDFNKIEYYMAKNGHEFDFIVRDEAIRLERFVQVCYDLRESETHEREFTAICEAMTETGIVDCTIVTDDVGIRDRQRYQDSSGL